MNKQELELIEKFIKALIDLDYQDKMGNDKNFSVVHNYVQKIKEKLIKEDE